LAKIDKSFNIIKANNGKLAYDAFCLYNEIPGNDNIKLIIMDCEMPVMDGFEASKNINSKI